VSRGTAFGILAGSAVLVTGTAVFVLIGIAFGLWVPRGGPTPTLARSGVTFDDVLDDVRDGRVIHVGQHDGRLTVIEIDRQVEVDVPSDSGDPFAEIAAAADEVGVDRPSFDIEGQPLDETIEPDTLDYARFLDEVRDGRVLEVVQQGSQLTVTTDSTQYLVVLDDPAANVLADIEQAARRGSAQPPTFTKLPD
jgi:hypothetical protein